MDEEREREEEQGAVRRPRVVDKRVSARTATPSQAPAEPRASQSAAIPEPPPDPPPVVPQSGPPKEAQPGEDPAGLWTPEQEAEAQRAVDEILRVPARDWVADAAVRLAQVAGVKLDSGDPADARVAIDAFGALVNGCAAELGEAERPLRQTLAQLQMAYAQVVAQPPQPPQP